MNLPTDRRSFLFALGALGIVQGLPIDAVAQSTTLNGFVLAPAEGEHLIHFRDHGNIFIKISAGTLAMGTQQVMHGSGIPVHRHLHMEEAFYILEGSGTCTLDDVPHSFEKGATIFIPRNTWHGFANPDQEVLLLWIMSPAGLDGFFRETCSPPRLSLIHI